jgi:protein SCO1/2
MTNFAPRRVAIVFVLGLAAASLGCGRSDKSEAGARHYEARGIVRGFAPDRSTVYVEHEAIPDFMPSMTMPFDVRDAKETANLKLGDAISFRLNVTQRDSWIDWVQRINAGQLHLPTSAPASPPPFEADAQPRLHEGDPMPDFTLIDEEGKPVTLETFRGHPFVVTFIFTRCPIPNFCPRMSQNFAELQKAIRGSSGAQSVARLLSISFDPEFDTPEVLKQYAEHAGADPGIWTFATGESAGVQKLTKAFSILVQPESGTISHSLATALIDRNGKVAKIWRGNGWTPAEAVREIVVNENGFPAGR